MQAINVYLYPNILTVHLSDVRIFRKRSRAVYSRPIKVYQGIDNTIQLVIRNQDQVPVDLTGYSVQIDIQDPNHQLTIASYAVDFQDITKGIGTVVFPSDIIDGLEQRFYRITTRTIQATTNIQAPLYIDDNFGVPLDMEVLPAYYSDTAPPVVYSSNVFDGGIIE